VGKRLSKGPESSGTLTVGDGSHSASILLLGNYSLASFHLGAETGGGTGTVVTDPPLTGGSVIAPPHG
jgi:large repetitive protein